MPATTGNFLDTVTAAEREAILARSDVRGWLAVAQSWALVVAGFLVAAFGPAPWAWLPAVVLIAGGQIGLAVLMHEAAHRSLFRSAALNEHVGRWLCANPVFTSLEGYRKYHMQHHRLAGTADDPDEYLTIRYPVSRASMRRKLLRDLFGLTGVKIYVFAVLAYSEYYKYQLNGIVEKHPNHDRPLGYHVAVGLRNLSGFLLSNALIALVLWVLGAAWLFLLWLVALFTLFQVLLRIRQIGDHGMVPDRLDPDPRMHTRTTDASAWERLLVSPHNEHLHLEHHLVPSAPCYRLPLIRRILEERVGIPDGAHARTYMDVMRAAVVS